MYSVSFLSNLALIISETDTKAPDLSLSSWKRDPICYYNCYYLADESFEVDLDLKNTQATIFGPLILSDFHPK